MADEDDEREYSCPRDGLGRSNVMLLTKTTWQAWDCDCSPRSAYYGFAIEKHVSMTYPHRVEYLAIILSPPQFRLFAITKLE